MLVLGLVSYLHASTTTTMLLNANLPELRGTVAGIGASLEDVSRAAGPALLPILLKATKSWNDSGSEADRQRRIISGAAMIWIFVGSAIMYLARRVEDEELRVKSILEDEAKASLMSEQKKRSLDVLDAQVKDVVKASTRVS